MADYYVATSGADSNPGTLAAPLRTLPAAIAKATAGSTIWMRGGTYSVGATVSLNKSGTAGAPITIAAYGGETPILRGAGADSVLRWAYPGTDYWTLRGLTVQEADDVGLWVEGDHNLIEDCVVRWCASTLILVRAGSYNTVRRCTVYGEWGNAARNGYNGIDLEDSDYATVEDCLLYDLQDHNGINSFPAPGSDWIGRCYTGHVYRRNWIEHAGLHGFYLRYLTDSQIVNNVVVDCLQWGMFLDATQVNGAPSTFDAHLLIANNTFVGNAWESICNYDANYLTVKNNIFASLRARPISCDTTTGHVFANNFYDPATVNEFRYGGATYSWATWRSALGFDLDGARGAAGFVDRAGGDLTLTAGSPAVGLAANLSAAFGDDFDGNPRPAVGPWDAGAYQRAVPYGWTLGDLAVLRGGEGEVHGWAPTGGVETGGAAATEELDAISGYTWRLADLALASDWWGWGAAGGVAVGGSGGPEHSGAPFVWGAAPYLSWALWRRPDGSAARYDAAYGLLLLDPGDLFVSDVRDLGDASTRRLEVAANAYGSAGYGSGAIAIRGAAAPFAFDAAEPAWEPYTVPTLKAWRYVQVRLST